MDHVRRKALIASLAEEAGNRSGLSPDNQFVYRRTIERLIELIYRETDPDSRKALVALLSDEEAARAAEAKLSGCWQS